jgi:hypothetical protein
MKLLRKADFVSSNAVNATNIFQMLLTEKDGTIQIDLGNNMRAGMQLMPTSDEDLAANPSLDEYLFYDFILNEEEKTILMDEDTTSSYPLDMIEDVIEYRLNKIVDTIE